MSREIREKKELTEAIQRSAQKNGCFMFGASYLIADALYNECYRKQSEGEWIKTETNYTCSKCSFNVISWSGEYDGYECERGISLMNFCPNCGAKMKGGAE